MKKPASIKINLVPQDPFFETTFGKALKWALSVGRYLVIFTELVVILSFASRFSLDRQVTDLNEALNQKQTIIESYGELEAQVKETQAKIDQYGQVEQQSNIAEIFPKLSRITPQDIRLDQLTIKLDTVALGGTAFSNASLNIFINNLQLSPDFFNVSVDKIETGDKKNPGFHFQIHANTKNAVLTKSQPKVDGKTNVLDRTQGM
jgi:Tfp pilus assembly protein PilN